MAGLIPLFISEQEQQESLDRERIFRDRNDPFDFYDDLELVQRFRFSISRSAILKITELIQNHLNSTDRSHAAHSHVQVCVALQSFCFGYVSNYLRRWSSRSQPPACRYIRAVALGLQSVYSTFISMPSPDEKATIKSQFYELAYFPGVLGLVDGTHIRISG